MTLLRIALVTLVLGVLVPGQARADATSEAKALFDRGNRALTTAMTLTGERRRTALTQALDAYVASLAIARNRNVVFNTGVALQELGRNEEAAAYYIEYLAFADLSAPEREEAEGRLRAVAAQTVLVDVTSEPAGASVRVDRPDMPVCGVTPLRVAVAPGSTHRVFVEAPDHDTAVLTVTGKAGDQGTLHAKLTPKPVLVTVRARPGDQVELDGKAVPTGRAFPVAPGEHRLGLAGDGRTTTLSVAVGQGPVTVDLATGPRTGTVVVESNVDAEVRVDGVLVGHGKRVVAPVPEGDHAVVVSAKDRADARAAVTVAAGQDAQVAATLVDDDASTSRYGAWPTLLWIGGGVALTASAVLSILAAGAKSDFDSNPTKYGADNVDAWNLRADIGWAATAALGITALVLTLTNDRKTVESSVVVGAVPVAGGGVIAARVGWP